MRRFIVTLLLAGFAAACGKSEARKRDEVKNCGAISLDAAGISRCLVAQFRWKQDDARVAGRARQQELDSIAAWQRDSAWRVDAKRHHQELTDCTARRGDVARCLQDYGWDEQRALAGFDSVWATDARKHRDQIETCRRQQGRGRIGPCLMLRYQWDSRHSLAVDDSLERARMKALKAR